MLHCTSPFVLDVLNIKRSFDHHSRMETLVNEEIFTLKTNKETKKKPKMKEQQKKQTQNNQTPVAEIGVGHIVCVVQVNILEREPVEHFQIGCRVLSITGVL